MMKKFKQFFCPTAKIDDLGNGWIKDCMTGRKHKVSNYTLAKSADAKMFTNESLAMIEKPAALTEAERARLIVGLSANTYISPTLLSGLDDRSLRAYFNRSRGSKNITRTMIYAAICTLAALTLLEVQMKKFPDANINSPFTLTAIMASGFFMFRSFGKQQEASNLTADITGTLSKNRNGDPKLSLN